MTKTETTFTQRRARRRGRFRSEDGVNLIEFAFVFPLLLMVILGIVDFAFIFHHHQVLTNAAREGARVAVLPGYDTPDIQTRVIDYVQAGGVPTTGGNPAVNPVLTTVVDGTGTWPATRVTVSYDYNYLFIGGIVGWFGGSGFNTLTLNAQATMRHEMRP